MNYGDYVLDFSYDINGVPVAMRHGYASHNNYVVYYYITNLQGDVVRLVDIYGNTAAYYEYDAFGNVLEASGSHANVNPLRYRGYVYDHDTGLYYLQSRYYDPKVGRFLNADSYTSTGQGILGNNMFAYCGNDPVNRVDYAGQLWSELLDLLETVVEESRKAMTAMAPAYAGFGGATLIDGPLPVADAFAVVGTALITIGAIGYGVYQVTKVLSASATKSVGKAEATVVTTKPNRLVAFPDDPNKFYPVGLVKIFRTGTKNGAFISWMNPITNTEVFRWDENPNYSNGPHYHICGGGHYYPGTLVPEPYASIYFPNK